MPVTCIIYTCLCPCHTHTNVVDFNDLRSLLFVNDRFQEYLSPHPDKNAQTCMPVSAYMVGVPVFRCDMLADTYLAVVPEAKAKSETSQDRSPFGFSVCS